MHLIQNPQIIDQELKEGAKKAREIARNVLVRVRKNVGY